MEDTLVEVSAITFPVTGLVNLSYTITVPPALFLATLIYSAMATWCNLNHDIQREVW